MKTNQFIVYFSKKERLTTLLIVVVITVNVGVNLAFPTETRRLEDLDLSQWEVKHSIPQEMKKQVQQFLLDTVQGRVSGYGNPIEINTADSAQWESLPMIGGYMAAQIVQYRTNLGGFHRIYQLLEIHHFQESTFEQIKHRLTCNGQINRLDVNTATVEALGNHPYISFTEAKRLVNYRKQHGPYQHDEEVKKAGMIADTTWEKVLPYLAVESTPYDTR